MSHLSEPALPQPASDNPSTSPETTLTEASQTSTPPVQIQAAAPAETGAKPNTINLAGWKVLIVDDEYDNLLLLEIVMDMHDAVTTNANSGEEALQFLRGSAGYSLILLDVQMPRVSGFDVLRAIRAGETNCPRDICVIAVTALAMEGDRDRIVQAGFDGYISKPIEAAYFTESVMEILRNWSLLRQSPQSQPESQGNTGSVTPPPAVTPPASGAPSLPTPPSPEQNLSTAPTQVTSLSATYTQVAPPLLPTSRVPGALHHDSQHRHTTQGTAS